MNEKVQPMRWHRQIAGAAVQDLPVKAVGTMLFIGVFFGAYFYLLNHPAYPTTVMPFTVWDELISFEPRAMPLYISLWVYVSLPPVLLVTRREMVAYAAAMAGTCLVGLIIFYVWPTAVPPAGIDWARHPGMDFLKSMDASGNACPSLHVVTALFSGFWMHHLLQRFEVPRWVLWGNWLWCTGIVYSTLATRQHVIVDVAGGLALGGLAAWLSLRYRIRQALARKIRPSCP